MIRGIRSGMMNNTFGVRFQQVVIMILTTAILIMLVFYGYRPTSYNLNVGSVCNRDIYATRNFVDSYQTEYEAVIAKNSVNAIFIRSDELSDQSVDNVENFFTLVEQTRAQRFDDFGMPNEDFDSEYENLKTNLDTIVGVTPSDDDLNVFINMSSPAFIYIEDKAVSIAEIVMMDNVSTDSLPISVDAQVDQFVNNNDSYEIYGDALRSVLKQLLIPNSVFDPEATNEAADNAYIAAKNDPITVDKGTKIIGAGEVVTEHIYQDLVDLELIRDDSLDIIILARIAAYEILIVVSSLIYLVNSRKKALNEMRITYTLVVTFLIPVIASIYLKDFSSIMVVTLFFTTICATYLGISAGIILSLVNMMVMWPLYNFDVEYIFTSIVGIIICSVLAGRQGKVYNSAALIIFPALFCIAASVIYNTLLGSTRNEYIEAVVWTGISAAFSTVIAIGLMPIYELFSNAVSPVRLIELSQPGHPLLKKLFIEASGTYQHSMLVANLADSAAEAIGADALLCRVAAYYHDIGKLENPKYFTENQAEGVNPHDDLTTEESVAIITAHPENGVKLAKKHKLPEPIIKIIDEHHGTMYPGYFYSRALAEAQANNLPAPDVEKFRYRGHIPSTKESAIVMIADTCEAAIKSTKKEELDEIEALVRKLIKEKIDHDQLIASGLSFEDIEKLIRAFRQVYAGVFHERIKYPNAN
ncbi:MAG: HDIG domain-containing protein [Clostridiales bacterium]|nr:HDIG domain-containing protein [Clostridiales bacterium]